jgi:hypothetical protein
MRLWSKAVSASPTSAAFDDFEGAGEPPQNSNPFVSYLEILACFTTNAREGSDGTRLAAKRRQGSVKVAQV